jgi:murein DD-endopeptidase MepM/ murein hydrolase activator NlpD
MMMARTAGTIIATGGLLLAISSCAPSDDEPLRSSSFAESLAEDVHLPAQVRIIADRVARGATLASLLRAHDVAEQEVAALVSRVTDVFDLRRFRAEQPYRLAQTLEGALRLFEYEIDGDRKLTVSRVPDVPSHEFVAEIADIPKTTELAVVRGAIDSDANSLFAAIGRAGEHVELSVLMAAAFASDIDFNTELQRGDTFQLLVEKQYRQDDGYGEEAWEGFAGYGAIVAAIFENDGRKLHAVRFTGEDGKTAYFDENGNSKKRFFLSSPLPFDPVVTSRFSNSRLHPVLGVRRAHLGVDYRAATGTHVIAVADGTVVFAAASGGSGRMVHLRHANGFETQYLHLSAIDVRRGQRVSQGERIGRVGSTGLATGPHLHYNLRQNGRNVNPVTAHRAMPPGDPVPAAERPAFEQIRDEALVRLTDAVGPGVSTN